MIRSVDTNNNQSNLSFKALNIKNPQKMTPEILKSLNDVKYLFDKYPHASVKLKTRNNIGIFSEDTGWVTLFGLGNNVRHTLHFNLGRDENYINMGKFILSGEKNSYDWASSFFENVRDAFRACKEKSYIRRAAFDKLNERINETVIQSKIKKVTENTWK